MIQVSKSAFEQKTLANEHYQLLIDTFKIDTKIDNILFDKKMQSYERKLFNTLKKLLKKIIVSPPYDLEKLDLEIAPLYKTYIGKKTYGLKGDHKKSALKRANNKIFSVFDYSFFITKNDGKFAYSFTSNLNITVCVYCNRQYTSTLWTEDGKCRPTLDHFFGKANFPYFALSFYNLIPSCYTCNSSLKNQEKFTLGNNLHPFIESMLDVLDFSIDISSVDFIEGAIENFNITLTPSKSCTDSRLINKAKANAKVFKIEELYVGHKDYASEIIKNMYYYDRSKVDELFNFKTSTGNKLFETREEVVEFALGNYIRKEKLGTRTLSKFTRDIASSLGIQKLL